MIWYESGIHALNWRAQHIIIRELFPVVTGTIDYAAFKIFLWKRVLNKESADALEVIWNHRHNRRSNGIGIKNFP